MGGAPVQPKGSLMAGVFVLANTILGAGMLGLPFAFASCGFFLGPLMLLAFGVCSATALILLSLCADKVGREKSPKFFDIASAAIPGVGTIIDVAVGIKCTGVATSYLIVVGDSVPKAIVTFGATGIWLDRRIWTLVALCAGGFAAYQRNLTALKNVSIVALTCVMCIVLMIVLFAVELSPAFDPCADHEAGSLTPCRGPVELFTEPITVLRALPLFVFSYTCHQNIFSITNELENRTPWRCAQIAIYAIGIALCVYIVLGTAGYLTFGSLVAKDILVSYPTSSYVVACARLAISLVVTTCYPLQGHPARAALSTLVGALTTKNEDRRKELANPYTPDGHKLSLLLTTLFIAVTGTIACTIHDLGLVLSVVGATGSTIVSYVLPGASYFLLFPQRLDRYLGFMLLTIGMIIMPLSLYLIFFH